MRAWLSTAFAEVAETFGSTSEGPKSFVMTPASARDVGEITDMMLIATKVPESWHFDMQASVDDAKLLLQTESLAALRFELVPATMEEATFWRTTFYCLENMHRHRAAEQQQSRGSSR